MKEKVKVELVAIFNRNLDNKLSIELCNGMLQSILALMDEKQEKEE